MLFTQIFLFVKVLLKFYFDLLVVLSGILLLIKSSLASVIFLIALFDANLKIFVADSLA